MSVLTAEGFPLGPSQPQGLQDGLQADLSLDRQQVPSAAPDISERHPLPLASAKR